MHTDRLYGLDAPHCGHANTHAPLTFNHRSAMIEARLPELEAGTATPFQIADALLARSADLLSGRTT